jgi:hypothetical protein
VELGSPNPKSDTSHPQNEEAQTSDDLNQSEQRSNLDFRPIKIKGAPLSETILRDRR